MLSLVLKRYESKRVNFGTEFSCPGELFNEDFKWTFLMISENLRPKKSENGLKLRIGGKC